jgi:hypothetical protein
MAYMHGIQVIEIGGSATIVAPVDGLAPVITSPLTATTRENAAWSMTLLADENVSFAKRTGADSAAFTLAGATLSLPAQDYEGGQTAFVCNLVAMDTAGNVTNFALTVTITDVDEIPPLITSPATATIAASTGYAVTLTANEAVTFEKRAGADGDLFGLAGTTLTLSAQAYNAGKVTFTVNLRAIDGAGNVTLFTHVVTIASPAPAADTRAPVITSALTATVSENTGWAVTLTADEAVTFSKRTGADSASFTLAGATLSLPAQDYEGGHTAFVCNLTAIDAAGNATDFAVTVNVTDLDEIAPLVTSAATATVAAATAYSVTLTANEAVTFDKRTGADSDSFTLTGATLTLPAQTYNSGKATFTANLRATDGAGNVTLFTHVVTIAAPATPALTITGPLAFVAGTAAGTLVFNIAGVPAGVTPTITPSDGRIVVAGDASAGWKGVIGLTASGPGATDYAVAATGTSGGTAHVVVTQAALSFGSGGLDFPTNFSAAVVAGNEYGYWSKRIYVNEDLPFGYLLYIDRAYTGAQSENAIVKNSGADKQILRVELVNVSTAAVTGTTNFATGLPVVDGNPITQVAGGIVVVRHGPLAKGVYDVDTYDYAPIGSIRTSFKGHEFANVAGDRYKQQATAFHSGTARPSGTGTITYYPKLTAALHVGGKRTKSVIGLGDSNEDQNVTYNGAFAPGPLRSIMLDPTIAGGSVNMAGFFRASSGPTAVFGAGTNGRQSIAELLAEVGTLLGYTDKHLFTDILWEHFRNGATGIINTTKTMLAGFRAKDPTIRLWPVSPYPYVRGTAGAATADKVPPADLYASVAGQTATDPDGTTTRDGYLAWMRNGGDGLIAGYFDDETEYAPAANPQVFNIGPAQKVKLATVEDASTGPNTIDLDFKPLVAEEIVVDPGLATQEFLRLSNSVAPIDLGGGLWRARLHSTTPRVTKQHALDAVAQCVLVADGTHANMRRQKQRRESARMATAKAALLAA